MCKDLHRPPEIFLRRTKESVHCFVCLFACFFVYNVSTGTTDTAIAATSVTATEKRTFEVNGNFKPNY